MKKLVLATALLTFSTASFAFIPKHRIAPEIKVSDNFLIMVDAVTQDHWKVQTDCDIQVSNNMVIKTHAREVKEHSKLAIITDNTRQMCQVTDLVKL